MKQRVRFWIICLTFLVVLSCGGSDKLPTVEPTPEPQATATTAATPKPKATAEVEDDETPEPTTEAVEPAVDDRQTRMNLLRATVQILALVKEGGQFQPIWTGSGTLLSSDGLILTNAHVVSDPDPRYQPDALGVAITVRSDDLPELKYLAEIRTIDEDLDLAVIQIVSDLSGDPIDPEQLGLTHVAIGDSDGLELGDLLQILGYPSIGGETITFTEGVVSGFTREPGVDGRAFIKTDATIAGGNSGGLAADLNGQIIGVPTQVGYGGAKRFADCRYLADTNNDGQINESDNCIPVGGFINAIRPVNLAKPLVESARLGIAPRATPQPRPKQSSGVQEFTTLVFAPDVNEQDLPTTIVTQLPSGATHLYACWEYAGMSSGLTWEARWYRDDEYLEDVSWPPALWKGDESGSWWVSVYNDEGLTEGTYHLELYVEGELLTEGQIPVGGAVSGPAFTNLIFSDEVTDDGNPTNPTYLLPSGITAVYAFFDYANMQEGMAWSRTWYYEGDLLASKQATWQEESEGFGWIGLSSDTPLDPGDYRLELFVEDTLLAAANFAVAGTQDQEAIGPITFAAGQDAQGNPINPGTTFPTGASELRFFVDYVGMQDGLSFDEQWYFDGEELFTANLVWDQGEEGTYTDNIYRKSGDPLWDGEYMLELYVEGELVQSATAIIGGGEPPPPTPEVTEGLVILGYVLDADTGRGIPGVLYVVLKPSVAIDDWEGDEDEVYTAAQTDAEGYFELPDPLERGQTYSIIVWAEGYRPVTGEDILIGDEASPFEVEITLQQE